jgi:hypothetical protein
MYELRYAAEDRQHISDGPKLIEIRPDFKYPVEVQLGTDSSERRRLFLIHGRECPQLGADYVLLQPEVVVEDPSRGWLPLGGVHSGGRGLGTEDTPELELGSDIDPDHAHIGLMLSEGVAISDGSDRGGTFVWAHSDDVLAVRG